MQLNWRRGSLSVGSGRVLQPELLECAGPEPADRNLRDIARINRWFGGHNVLLRLMRDLVDSHENFSLFDVGARSRFTMGQSRLPLRSVSKNLSLWLAPRGRMQWSAESTGHGSGCLWLFRPARQK